MEKNRKKVRKSKAALILNRETTTTQRATLRMKWFKAIDTATGPMLLRLQAIDKKQYTSLEEWQQDAEDLFNEHPSKELMKFIHSLQEVIFDKNEK